MLLQRSEGKYGVHAKRVTILRHMFFITEMLFLLNPGHPGRSMYFIVSGNVLIQVTETDKHTGCSKKQVTVSFISNRLNVFLWSHTAKERVKTDRQITEYPLWRNFRAWHKITSNSQTSAGFWPISFCLDRLWTDTEWKFFEQSWWIKDLLLNKLSSVFPASVRYLSWISS